MPYRLVKGEFHLFYKKQKLVGSQPDGDSVWFKPEDRALLGKLGDGKRHQNFAQYDQTDASTGRVDPCTRIAGILLTFWR